MISSQLQHVHVVKNVLGREFAENEHLQDLEYVHRAYRSVLPVTVVASDPRRLESVAQRPQQQVDQPAQQLGLHQQSARGKKVPRGYRRGGACPDPRSVSCVSGSGPRASSRNLFFESSLQHLYNDVLHALPPHRGRTQRTWTRKAEH